MINHTYHKSKFSKCVSVDVDNNHNVNFKYYYFNRLKCVNNRLWLCVKCEYEPVMGVCINFVGKFPNLYYTRGDPFKCLH